MVRHGFMPGSAVGPHERRSRRVRRPKALGSLEECQGLSLPTGHWPPTSRAADAYRCWASRREVQLKHDGHDSGDMHTSRIECEAYVRIMMAGYPTTVPTKDGRALASAADDRRKEG